ncbi:hypothetical protein [Paenibacillus sp. H1-7]|uniref:hypothetical protein n=1 Tax=Paenibacillus sp. H1-7 TaxID=2282849 RepID=UPI001EF94086|nr:hypothetical protein [Paenibacillus sp. H1-7]
MRRGLPIACGTITIASSLLLGGCNTLKTVPPQPVPPAAAPAPAEDEIQRETERDMVILFQGLIQLDKQQALVITKTQAEAMLPVVKRNSSKGELTAGDQQRIIAMLTTEQKKFVIEYRDRILTRMRVMMEKKEPEGLTAEERERMVQEFQKKRRLEHEAGDPDMVPRDAPESGPTLVPNADQRRANNVEQRLIRLLEGKLAVPPE